MNSIDELFPAEKGDNGEDIKVGEKDIITAISATLKEISDGNQKTLTDITNTFAESLKSVVKNAGTDPGSDPGAEPGTEPGTDPGQTQEQNPEQNPVQTPEQNKK